MGVYIPGDSEQLEEQGTKNLLHEIYQLGEGDDYHAYHIP